MQIISKQQAIQLGLKRYFTGKPCKQGHISERYVAKSTCCECLKVSASNRIDKKRIENKKRYQSRTEEQKELDKKRLREYMAKKYAENPEKFRKLSLDYRNNNLEKSRERSRKYKEENRDKILSRRREQYAENPEKYRKFRTDYYARNTDLEKARTRVWQSRNVVYYGRLREKRLLLIRQATPKWADQNKIDEIYLNRPEGHHVDHMVPLDSEFVCGLHVEHNLQYLTVAENIRKRNHHWPDMWE